MTEPGVPPSAGLPAGDDLALAGNRAPVDTERTVEIPLPMEGAVPDGLEGLLLRNGPNPARLSDDGAPWLAGDGMVHAVELRKGRAVSYRNRWVRTRKLSAEIGTRYPAGPLEPVDGPANTHVVFLAGRVLALGEQGLPYRMTTDLATLRVEDFDATLGSPMCAHPRTDPDSGATAFFGTDPFGPPYLRYHELDPDGLVVHTTEVPVPRCTMAHDFGVTASRVVFLDLPVVLDTGPRGTGDVPRFRWAPDAGARVGVLPRGGDGADTAWIDVDPCFVFHVMNAYDDGAEVVLDVLRYPDALAGGGREAGTSSHPHLQRWRVDPERAAVGITDLDDRAVELPRVDDTLAGRLYRYGYCVELGAESEPGGCRPVALVRYDLARDESVRRTFGEGTEPSEPLFVRAADGRADDEGWVVTVVYDPGRDASDVVILDGTALEGRPEAVIHLPARVPTGLHGSWVPRPAYR